MCIWAEQPFSNGAKQYLSTGVLVANHHAGPSSIWMNYWYTQPFPSLWSRMWGSNCSIATAYLELEQQEEIWRSEKLMKLVLKHLGYAWFVNNHFVIKNVFTSVGFENIHFVCFSQSGKWCFCLTPAFDICYSISSQLRCSTHINYFI